ncbi:hypothetical protein GUITHDRAFT_106663 [Guillardia theta CCMP2712]|uniref:TNFR-Cys domain-containing protein n=1 Tax=Guillardia theta (strain CCMP2712) TaxID=905079 RepID=L1JHV1_GUITC|nr:hypothetical protein GUITHDRAFT_106663 [Guillardia theta CCMP2712]EKX47675.1 hypothetical protein GUITHDRAFT_106663 [Guillardia theta CCMP2712]|eukprot:XP_005834655.1 hypothetical protein GUITHDRAFT_106663 [Guillardia theta CCMP2712]
MSLSLSTTYSPHTAVQDSTAALVRLTSGGSPVDCGQTVDAGSLLPVSFTAPTGSEYLIEVVASSSSAIPFTNGRCTGKRLDNNVGSVTVPPDGTITIRAAWSTSRSAAIFKSPDCVYTVMPSQGCEAGLYLDSGECVSCPTYSTSPAQSTSADACQCLAGYTSSSGSCQACPAGSYKPTVGSEACSPCPTGSFSTLTAASSSSACVACRSTCAEGEKEIVACSATTNRVCIPANCSKCEMGQFLTDCNVTASHAGTCVQCSPCALGQYRDGCAGMSAGECKACPTSTETSEGGCSVADQVCVPIVKSVPTINFDVTVLIQLAIVLIDFTSDLQAHFIHAVALTAETLDSNVMIVSMDASSG